MAKLDKMEAKEIFQTIRKSNCAVFMLLKHEFGSERVPMDRGKRSILRSGKTHVRTASRRKVTNSSDNATGFEPSKSYGSQSRLEVQGSMANPIFNSKQKQTRKQGDTFITDIREFMDFHPSET